ncbi:MAG: hypothetical protein MJ071_09645 [Oscillospiraceae bacterium]|nr:hypothetical protein [Oscillospiraceae bacterium]
MNELTTRILKMLLLFFAVVLAFSIFYHLLFTNYETETAIFYSVSDISSFEGVYVRNETVERYSGSGSVRYCVSDGEKLGIGSVIAEVYSNVDQIDLRKRIAQKEEELAVLNRIENPGTSENAQPAHLATLIDEQYKALIHYREIGEMSSMNASKSDLALLMNTYSKITDSTVDYQDRIVALEDEISRLKQQKTSPDKTIVADRSAYFVGYTDGYEEMLTTENMRQLTPEQLQTVSDDGSGVRDDQAIGKLIDGYAWYIVGIFDNTKMRLSEDDVATVRLESLPRTLRVKVESLASAGDITHTQAVFRCDQMSSDVVQHRSERVEIICNSAEGIRIPRSAIRFKNLPEEIEDESGNLVTRNVNCMGVYVLVGESAEFRRVDVIYKDDNYYLSSMNAGSGYVSLYDDIIVKGVMADGN